MNRVNVEHQQNVAWEVLSKIKYMVDDEAIIAGGAPRNWFMYNSANDIDIYLRSHVDNTRGRVEWMVRDLLGDRVKFKRSSDVEGYKFGLDVKVRHILTFDYKAIEFQLIFCEANHYYKNFKEDIVSHMDIGINRIYCDWYCDRDVGRINKTKEFCKDYDNNVLTLYQGCMSTTQLEHCIQNHLIKMKRYFPGYSLDITDRSKL